MNKRTITIGGYPVTVVGKPLAVGDTAPDFSLLDNDFNPVSLQDFGNQIKLISIVPSLDTGVCDHQTRRFNQELSSLDNVAVITVSVDLPFAQKRWCGSAGLDHAVTLSDYLNVEFGKAYGVLIEERRLLARAVLVLDGQNKVTYAEYLDEVSKHPDYDKALAAVKALL